MKNHGRKLLGSVYAQIYDVLPDWTSSDKARIVFDLSTDKMYYGNNVEWVGIPSASPPVSASPFLADQAHDIGTWRTAGGAWGATISTTTFPPDNGTGFYGPTWASPPSYTHMWIVFQNVTIPAGATIVSSHIKLYSPYTNTLGKPVTYNLHFNDADDATYPTSVAIANALSLTSAVSWYTGDIGSTPPYATTDTPDLSSALQEVINRPGWASGNNLMYVQKYSSMVTPADNTENRYTGAGSYSGNYYIPELHVVYTEA